MMLCKLCGLAARLTNERYCEDCYAVKAAGWSCAG